ncbi:dihydropteroate synthase [Flavicella sp.]|uniref:dihydropteroate synthase n=1 Tax=Flavicella sp. TaxID=2957742 RepID=UPI0030185265
MRTINCKGKLIDLSSPKIMGILNITPDSFFDGGKYRNKKSILKQVNKMLTEGATFIDVGAYSSRPGAEHITEKEELNRILPIVNLLIDTFPKILISIDTFRSEVANQCITAGAAMINDISGGDADKNMFATAVALQVPYIIMHMQGTPQNMQDNPCYKDVLQEVAFDLANKSAKLKKMGLNDFIIDLGFGFGKTIADNYMLLNNLDRFQLLDCPILTGISRKSMLYKPLNIDANMSLNATTFANTIALQRGSHILRVHDIKEANEIITLHSLLSNS